MFKSSYRKGLLLGLGLLMAASTCLAEALPRLVDVGADKCVPCKLMAGVDRVGASGVLATAALFYVGGQFGIESCLK